MRNIIQTVVIGLLSLLLVFMVLYKSPAVLLPDYSPASNMIIVRWLTDRYNEAVVFDTGEADIIKRWLAIRYNLVYK